MSTAVEQSWPGERLGLPERGSGSVAGWGKRVLALVADWLLSMLAAGAFVGTDVWSGGGAGAWAPLTVFALQVWLLTALLGASAGQRLLGIRVVAVKGGPVSLWSALIRTLLICLVIPPVIYDRDQRGLHDLAVGTIVVRR